MKREVIDRAKSIPIIEILDKLNIPHESVGSNYKIRCILHEEYNNSMVVYDDHVYCFGCAASLDGIELVRKILGLSFTDAVEFINLLDKIK